MKSWILCFALFSVSQAAQAQLFEFNLGLNATSFDYKEELDPPLKSTEKATFPTVYGKAKRWIPELGKSFVSFEGEFSGDVNSEFDGATLPSNTSPSVPVKNTNTLSFYRMELDFYGEVYPNSYLYSGLGYRIWNRYLRGGSGYREIYSWAYLPLGILWEFPLFEKATWGIDVSYRIMFAGEIKVIFSENITNGDDTTLTLGNRPGYRIQAPFRYALEGGYGVTVNPWYEYSEIGESNTKYNATVADQLGGSGYIAEPSSKTTQYGLIVGVSKTF